MIPGGETLAQRLERIIAEAHAARSEPQPDDDE